MCQSTLANEVKGGMPEVEEKNAVIFRLFVPALPLLVSGEKGMESDPVPYSSAIIFSTQDLCFGL